MEERKLSPKNAVPGAIRAKLVMMDVGECALISVSSPLAQCHGIWSPLSFVHSHSCLLLYYSHIPVIVSLIVATTVIITIPLIPCSSSES